MEEELRSLHHWNVLVVTCIDGRFIKRVCDWAEEQAGKVFDFRTEVGCSKAIIDSTDDRIRLFELIRVSSKLHSITEVWLADHIDCGAYGGSKSFEGLEQEVQIHTDRLVEAGNLISNEFPELKVRKFFVDWENIKELN